jgi:multiple sugar transport system ATP-binding protein
VVLNKGDIQQVDTPLNIYRQPANQFVASFMGCPAMNFLTVHIDPQGYLHSDSLTRAINLSDVSLKEIGCDRSFTLGFRPEDLQPSTADDAHFVGIVELVEALGSETIVLLKVNDTEIRARVSADIGLEQHWQIGDRSFWRFDLHKLYGFDAQTGLTLHHPYKKR